jgi:hypothetical protein
MQLDPATKEMGFKCITRSAEEVIRGPKSIHIPPDPTLEAVGAAGRCVRWNEPLTFEAWTVPERRALGFPDQQSKRPRRRLHISDILPPSGTGVWDSQTPSEKTGGKSAPPPLCIRAQGLFLLFCDLILCVL